jgi:hypothetical protein
MATVMDYRECREIFQGNAAGNFAYRLAVKPFRATFTNLFENNFFLSI